MIISSNFLPHFISIIGGNFITFGSTYHGELSPYSFTVHTTTTKKKYFESHLNFSSSTLDATSQHICLQFLIRVPNDPKHKCQFTLKMLLFLLNSLKGDISKGVWRDLINSGERRSLFLG